jgi:hypothetical protein
LPAQLDERNAAELLGSPLYCLHALAQVGRLTGYRYFGEHDWYQAGARYLLSTQKADGSWQSSGRFEQSAVISTAFALLFLAEGQKPVLVVKLAYGKADSTDWNNKRSDVRNLVSFTSRELFKGQPLAWQVCDIRGRPEVDDKTRRRLAAKLRAAAVVFVSGHVGAPDGNEEALLKEYLDQGGFVLAEACCGDQRFDKDFRSLIKRLFPDAPLKPLRPDHPLWRAAGKCQMSPKDFPLEGIEKDGRVVVVYSPKPLANAWAGNERDKPRGREAFRAGAAVLAYATGLKPPRGR